MGPHEVEGQLGVARDVAVADHHGHVGGQPLGTERGGTERGRHREEDHRAAFLGREDRAALAAGDVHADDGQVGSCPGAGDGVAQRHRVAGIADQHLVGKPRGREEVRLALVRYDGDGAPCTGPPSRGQAQGPGLARATDDHHHRVAVPADVALGECRRPADVEHGQREWGGQVVGELCRDAAAEQDRVAVRRQLLAVAVPAGEVVLDDQRGQGQRHQRRDMVAHGEAERGPLPHLLDGADQHPARSGDGVVHLAAAADDLEHLGADGGTVATVLLLELAEGSRVEVEALHADAHLVVEDLPGGVEPVGCLGQHAPGLEHPVQADRITEIACHGHETFPFIH